jgi:hypothetical protein
MSYFSGLKSSKSTSILYHSWKWYFKANIGVFQTQLEMEHHIYQLNYVYQVCYKVHNILLPHIRKEWKRNHIFDKVDKSCQNNIIISIKFEMELFPVSYLNSFN